MNWLKSLIAPVNEIFAAKIELKKVKMQWEATAFQTAAQNTAHREKLAGQNAANSYLDELWTGVLLVPLVLAFAGYGDTVDSGFKALENMPDFYVWSVMASVGWAFARKDLPKLSSWRQRTA